MMVFAVARAWSIRPAAVAEWPDAEIEACAAYLLIAREAETQEVERAYRSHGRA